MGAYVADDRKWISSFVRDIMFTTQFKVKTASTKEMEAAAMKLWRREFGTCNLEVNVMKVMPDESVVEVTCTTPTHDHTEGAEL